MATRKSINNSGHYVVSINSMPFHICNLNSKKTKGRAESYYIYFFDSTTIQHGVLISSYYVKFIPTAISSL